MNCQDRQILSARFRGEAEADVRYGLAEGLDPHAEYAALVARLSSAGNGTTSLQKPGSTEPMFYRAERMNSSSGRVTTICVNLIVCPSADVPLASPPQPLMSGDSNVGDGRF